MAESKSNIRLTKDTPYLALMGKLPGVLCEDFGKNLLHYNSTAPYCAALDLVMMELPLYVDALVILKLF